MKYEYILSESKREADRQTLGTFLKNLLYNVMAPKTKIISVKLISD